MYRKKLIEVALPLEDINEASAREKGNPFRKEHPRNLHQWWSRKPIAACHAAVIASLIDDPSGDPERFPTDADQQTARKRLHSLIKDLLQ